MEDNLRSPEIQILFCTIILKTQNIFSELDLDLKQRKLLNSFRYLQTLLFW
jgi:hypothetical protein